MRKRPTLYVHKTSGNIVKATKSQAKRLPPEYEKIDFVKNDQGKPVMRLKLDGATVDISEREMEPENVNASAK